MNRDIINDMANLTHNTQRFLWLRQLTKPPLILLASLLLTNCATTPPPEQPLNQATPWVSRTQALATIKNWNLKGLISIRTPKDAWTADWQWSQTHDNYTISLFGPLGSHAIKLTGTPNHVLLETSDGKKFTSTSPESLLNEQLGWQIPVSYLHYWVRGLPVPNVASQKKFDNYNHLAELTQQGWVIQYLRYTAINQIDVPNKIFLINPDLKVKIIINQWELRK